MKHYVWQRKGEMGCINTERERERSERELGKVLKKKFNQAKI